MRALGLEGGWPLVPLLAFTPWVAAGSLIPIAVALVLRRRMAALAGVAVAVVFAVLVLPRAFGGGAEVADGVPLRVLSTNVLGGEGDAEFIAGLVGELEVDVLSVQELTPAFTAELERELGGRLAHRVIEPLPGVAGCGIFSSLPLRALAPGARLPGGFALPRAELQPPGAGPVELAAVHVVPPTESAIGDWDDDLRALPDTDETPLRVLAGDFNATLDHAELRAVLDRGYTDAADAAGAGLTPTWSENWGLGPLVTIDHVLADDRIGVEEVSVHTVPGSDHRAVFAALALPPL